MKTKTPAPTLKVYLHLAAVLGLLLIPRPGMAASISCGQTVANTTTTDSQVDQYSFSGSAGQVVSVSIWSSLTDGGMEADIY